MQINSPHEKYRGDVFLLSLARGGGEKKKRGKSVKLLGIMFQMKQVTLFYTVHVYIMRISCRDVQMDSKWV